MSAHLAPSSANLLLEAKTAAGRLRFDRRVSGRGPREGSAMAAFYDEDGAVCLTRVEFVDASVGGLGVRCPMPIAAGTRVHLSTHGAPIAHTTGVVVHCRVEEDATRASSDDAEGAGFVYRLGLRTDAPKSAA